MASYEWPSDGSGSGITSINTDATAAQTLAVGTAGTDFAIVDNGSGTHTFNLPSASATARGVVSTGTQTFAGNKTFSGSVALSGGTTGLVEQFTGFLESPTDKIYVLDQSAAYAYTINTIIVATASGTTTLAVKINGTNVTGISAVSVSSTPATGTATAANAVAVGNQVTMVLSAGSSAADMGFTMKYTRS